MLDLADRVAVLDFGTKIAEGAPLEVAQHRGHRSLCRWRGRMSVISDVVRRGPLWQTLVGDSRAGLTRPEAVALRDKSLGIWEPITWIAIGRLSS